MKAFYAALLIALGLFVLMGLCIFAQGAYEHFNRPLVSLDRPGIQSRLTESLPRATVEISHVCV